MNFYVEGGKNIESAEEINESLRTATALCGFNSSVMDIQERKNCEKQSNIKDISKIRCIKYIVENGVLKYHVSQNYVIGKGKVFPVGEQPVSIKRKITIPIKQDHQSVAKANVKSKNNEIVYCSEPLCVNSNLNKYLTQVLGIQNVDVACSFIDQRILRGVILRTEQNVSTKN